MVEVNGKEYKINLDMKLGTQKLMRKILDNPNDPKAQKYLEMVLKDMLIPSPTVKELFHFRFSDVERIFNNLDEDADKVDSDFKKKLSQQYVVGTFQKPYQKQLMLY